jgi:fructosamine-3-kinase
MIPTYVVSWIEENNYGQVIRFQRISGGCINQGMRIHTSSSKTFFLKTNAHAPSDMFYCEAQGLEALSKPNCPRVPKSIHFDSQYILLEDLRPAENCEDYWPTFGRQLATLHHVHHSQFGFVNGNYIGKSPQLNTWSDDGFEFFAKFRLRFQGRMALNQGLLNKKDFGKITKLSSRLEGLIPKQPASLSHGDLWTGNAISDSDGMPAIIDPAVYYGWAEADLAMTTLFGKFPDVFYSAYQELCPLEKNFVERFPIYNLYHLLNHLNLFGTSYLGQVRGILEKFK